MRRFLLPSAIYAALSTAHFVISGAPMLVHVLSVAILAVAFLIPSIWAGHLLRVQSRLLVCALCAIVAMLAWDATAHLIIVKVEPFFVLRSNSWLYLFGCLAFNITGSVLTF